jgi:glucose-6-phosphate 1-epimerase
MEIEIWSDQAKAIVDPEGGYLTNLSDDKGDILFPKRTLKNEEGIAKKRGGSHVCLPNFGPGGTSGQEQHGFGRESAWEITDKTDSSVLLTLANGPDGYRNLNSVLTYQLGAKRMTMTLEVTNNGGSDLRVAPAFHPYFALLGGSALLDGEKQSLSELGEAQFFTGNSHTLQLEKRTITLEATHLPTWVKWTDQLGDYLCVGPSQSGFAFLEDKAGDGESLYPDETKTYTFTITWN